MKNVLIIGSKNAEGKNDIQFMAAHMSEPKSVTLAYWEDLLVTITDNQVSITDARQSIDLKDFELVMAFNWYKTGSQKMYRDLAFSVALYLEDNKVTFWNREMIMQRSTTKLSAMVQLALNGFPVPNTLFSLDAQRLLSAHDTFPVIAKDAAASRGRNNHLCHSADELSKVIAAQPATNQLLLQEFIPNESDLRVVCFGGKPALAIKRSRQSAETHLNNTSQGAVAELIELTNLKPEIIENTSKICYTMGRDMAGVDFLFDKDNPNRYVVLEVNAIPQLTSGSYVTEKMAALEQTLTEL